MSMSTRMVACNRAVKTLLTLFLMGVVTDVPAQVSVQGYYRKDGTYVKPHYRSTRDGVFANNWTTLGNINPYTRQPGTIASPPLRNTQNTQFQSPVLYPVYYPPPRLDPQPFAYRHYNSTMPYSTPSRYQSDASLANVTTYRRPVQPQEKRSHIRKADSTDTSIPAVKRDEPAYTAEYFGARSRVHSVDDAFLSRTVSNKFSSGHDVVTLKNGERMEGVRIVKESVSRVEVALILGAPNIDIPVGQILELTFGEGSSPRLPLSINRQYGVVSVPAQK